MKNKKVTESIKNAVGTMFLLAGAFLVCSTFVSMRTVWADPVAPDTAQAQQGQNVTSPRASSGRTSRTSPRSDVRQNTNVARTVVKRNNTATTTGGKTTTGNRTVAGRTVASRSGNVANTTLRSTSGTSNASASGRTVVARTSVSGVAGRNVRSRTAVADSGTTARVSLQGNAIRGAKSTTTSSSSYTYLSSKLYAGNYSNIIDSTTGLISADAYQTCLESYYTCMDEICTARNANQGRCSCAARTKAFADAEDALETANEELIRVSGELALLVATKGKDVSSAFMLTDAEKIMNCASYAEVRAGGDSDELKEWCENHREYNNGSVTSCDTVSAPSYCSEMGANYGFDLSDLSGNSSDILASLKTWADAKDNAISILTTDNTNLLDQYSDLMNVVSGMGLSITDTSSSSDLDALANTWGYELFQYAHNNVCGRVLDSCFNGIYEACGTPPKDGKCANGATSSCPYNYNSYVTVATNGDVTLNERGRDTNATTSSSASCFGYTTTSGDPYSSLRGPVADARRSVMQKYLLDANAACDTYGEQLRTTAQNIGYQKVAAQQALQQKRLEFAQEEETSVKTDYRTAVTNYASCLDELLDCYTTQQTSNASWSNSRIKAYCAQVSNSPHCYETMVCVSPNTMNVEAVITRDDDSTKACENTSDYKTNTCRNVVTLNEILSTSFGNDAVSGSSTEMRKKCLNDNGANDVRNFFNN